MAINTLILPTFFSSRTELRKGDRFDFLSLREQVLNPQSLSRFSTRFRVLSCFVLQKQILNTLPESLYNVLYFHSSFFVCSICKKRLPWLLLNSENIFFSSSRHSGLKYTTTKQFPSVQIFASRAAISLKFDQKIPFLFFFRVKKMHAFDFF